MLEPKPELRLWRRALVATLTVGMVLSGCSTVPSEAPDPLGSSDVWQSELKRPKDKLPQRLVIAPVEYKLEATDPEREGAGPPGGAPPTTPPTGAPGTGTAPAAGSAPAPAPTPAPAPAGTGGGTGLVAPKAGPAIAISLSPREAQGPPPGGPQPGEPAAAREGARGGERVGVRAVPPMVRYRTPRYPGELLFAPDERTLEAGAPPAPAPESEGDGTMGGAAPPAATAPEASPSEPPPGAEGPAMASAPAVRDEDVEWRCPRCQEKVTKEMAGCPLCGLQFAPEDVPSVSEATPPSPPAPPAPPPGEEPGGVPMGAVPAEPGAEPAPTPPTEPPPTETAAVPPTEPTPPGPTEGTPAPEPTEPVAPPPTEPTPPPPSTAEATPAPTEPPAPPRERLVCYMCQHDIGEGDSACPACGFSYVGVAAAGTVMVGGKPVGDIQPGTWVETGPRQIAYLPDPRQLQTELKDLITRYGAFSDVGLIDNDSIRGNLDQLLNNAADNDYDFLLVPKLKKCEIKYVSLNGNWVPALLMWIAAWVPSWWFGAETYAIDVELEVSLYFVPAEEKGLLYRGVYTNTIFREFDLDQFDRGWYPWSLWTVPFFGWIRKGGWTNMTEVLPPSAIKEVEREVLVGIQKFLEKGFIPPPSKAERAALIAGGNFYKNAQVLALKYADEDIAALTKFVTDSAKGDFSERHVRALIGSEAETADIRDWLTGDLQRRRVGDTVLFYWSGYGAVEQDESGTPVPYLVTYDADPANLKGTAISLKEIAEAFDTTPAKRVLFIFDCSFVGDRPEAAAADGNGRSLPGQKLAAASLGEQWFVDLAQRPGKPPALVITASAPIGTEVAMEFHHLGHGNLTKYIVDGIGAGTVETPAADKDNDGLVQLQELIPDLEAQVPSTAAFSAVEQNVKLYGDIQLQLALLKPATKKAAGVGGAGTEKAPEVPGGAGEGGGGGEGR